MSKLFFDKYISLSKLEKTFSQLEATLEEKHELWQLVDEIIHHRVLNCILTELPKKNHEEFLVKLHSAPHSEDLLVYLKEKIVKDIDTFLSMEIKSIENEILKDLVGTKKSKHEK